MALTFKFNADGSGYTRGLQKMRTQTKAFAGSVGGMMVSAFAGGAALAWLKNWIDGLDRVGKLASRLGASSESLQRLAYAAELNGSNLETVANALTKVKQNAGQATNGLKSYGDAFARLNIDHRAFQNLAPDEQIIQLASAYQQAQKSGTGMADILLVLGGRAKELIPLLSQGSEQLRDTLDAASTASEGVVKGAELVNDTITTIKNTLTGYLAGFIEFFIYVGAAIAASMDIASAYVSAKFEELGKKIVKWSEIIGKGLTGDFDGAGRAYDELAAIGEASADKIAARYRIANVAIEAVKRQVSGNHNPADDAEPVDVEAEQAKFALLEKTEKLKKEVLDLERKTAFDALEYEQKKNILAAKRLEIMKAIAGADGKGGEADLTALTARKDLEALNKEETSLDQSKATKDKAAADKRQSLDDKESAVEIANYLATLNDEEKLGYYQDEQAHLLKSGKQEDRIAAKELESVIVGLKESIQSDKEQELSDRESTDQREAAVDESNAMADMTDAEKAAYLRGKQKNLIATGDQDDRIEAKELESEIRGLEDAGGKKGASILTTSLASIGGGGNSAMTGDPQLSEAKRQTSILDRIAANTQPKSSTAPTPEI